jgi:hypothetical protein
MESFYAYSLSAKATLEVHSAQEGNEPVAEKPILEMQDYDRLPQRESQESMITLLESEKHPEEKPVGKEKLTQELAKPEKGFRRLLWHLVETIISREMVLRQEYRRRATEKVSGLSAEELRTLIGRLEIILWRTLRVIIAPIFRLALSEYRKSVSELLNQGGGETGETTQQGYR